MSWKGEGAKLRDIKMERFCPGAGGGYECFLGNTEGGPEKGRKTSKVVDELAKGGK